MTFKCRHCTENLNDHILDLGHQPPSNNYLSKDQLNLAEFTYPLKVFICSKCGLVQLPEFLKPEELLLRIMLIFQVLHQVGANMPNHLLKKLSKN